MRSDRSNPTAAHHGEEGISPVISTILMICLAVVIVMIVATLILSEPLPDETPYAAIFARNESGNFTLAHMAGDPLKEGAYRIYVDTINGLIDETANFTGLKDGIWSAGEILTYNGMEELERVVITAMSGGTEVILADLGPKRGSGAIMPTETVTPTPTDPPDVNFIANITGGNAPLAVQFSDTSTGNPGEWHWDFGDGNTSTEQNPIHTYESPGNYTVNLTATNTGGSNTETKIDYIKVTGESFIDFIIEENVFVYGNTLALYGDSVTGPGATVVITGDLNTANTNLGASINVSNVYIDGDVNISSGSASLGSPTNPGRICINGNLKIGVGSRNIYGEVYVNGSCDLEGVWLHGNMSVNGDLTLRRDDTGLEDYARIYYTGTLASFNNVNASTLEKCIKQETVQGFAMPEQEIPPTKPEDWYTDKGYATGGPLEDDIKIFASSYSSSGSATNVVIIASSGDISITGWGNEVTGVFFAPNGGVTFSGNSLEGVVIARDGFYVTSGGTKVTFKNIEDYIADPEDYPF